LPLPQEIRNRMLGVPNVIEDFGTLATITIASDAIWFSSPYAAKEELRAGQLCELPRPEDFPHEVRVCMYSLERRSQSPWARTLKQLLRAEIKTLAKFNEAATPH
jgi:DNA-binding transcriptional LysR family regulator